MTKTAMMMAMMSMVKIATMMTMLKTQTIITIMLIMTMIMTMNTMVMMITLGQAGNCVEANPLQDARPDQPEACIP